MATSPTSQHSYSRFIGAARALDRSPKGNSSPAPEHHAQPTLNDIARASQAETARKREAAYLQKTLTGLLGDLQAAVLGVRNIDLNKHSFRLGKFVGRGLIDRMTAETELHAAGEGLGLPRAEVTATVRSGLNAGVRKAYELRLPDFTDASDPPAESDTMDPAAVADSELVRTLNAYPRTDAGNAEALELLYGAALRYDHSRKTWLSWDGTRWLLDEDGYAHRQALDTVRTRRATAALIKNPDESSKLLRWALMSESLSKRTALLASASTLETLTTTITLYDADPLLAGLPNGTLDLRTAALRPADPLDYITMQLGTAYDPAASAPLWHQFLREVFGDDGELIAYIQRAVGYSLTGDMREQKLFLCLGVGSNGKSVLLEVLAQLLGQYAGTAGFDTFDANRRSDQTADLAALKGKRLVTVIETDEDRRLAEARVKAVTGQDPITCAFKFGAFFTYRPTYKIWMAMNHKPIIRGSDRGIWRRIQLIPFAQSFEGREDKELIMKLQAELPGILNWALDGLRAWWAEGLGKSVAVEAATAEYRLESDLVAQWLADAVVEEEDGRLPAAEAIEAYRAWCKTYGYREPTATALKRSLIEKGYAQQRFNRGNMWLGLRIATDADATANPDTAFATDQRVLRSIRIYLGQRKFAEARAKVAELACGDAEKQRLLTEIADAERGS